MTRRTLIPRASNQDQRAFGECDDGRPPLVGQQLAGDDPGVVVDDRVEVVVPERVGALHARGARRSPVTAWPGGRKRG
jgi:hypothetical protein